MTSGFLLPDQAFENAFRDMEVRAPQALKRILQIEQAQPGRRAQNADCSGYRQMQPLGLAPAAPVVDDSFIGSELLREQDGVAFADFDVCLEQLLIRRQTGGAHFKPCLRRGNP